MTAAFTFDPFDPAEARSVVTMLAALHGHPDPACVPTAPDPLAVPLAVRTGGAHPTASPDPNTDRATSPPAPDGHPTGWAQASTPCADPVQDLSANPVIGAGADVCPGENSAAFGLRPATPQQPGSGADPQHTPSNTAGQSLSAVAAGEDHPSLTSSPACPLSAPAAEPVGGAAQDLDRRGNSQVASAPAPSFQTPALRPPLGGQLREDAMPPAHSLPEVSEPVTQPAAPTPAATEQAAGAPDETDWPALVARVIEGGESIAEVVRSAGIRPAVKLSARVAHVRRAAQKAAAGSAAIGGAKASAATDGAADESHAPEPPVEEPIPGAPADPDPAPVREPEPIDARQPAADARPRIDVRRREADPDWAPILARVDAGERPDMVALDEGVDLKALQDKLRARIAAASTKAAAAPAAKVPAEWTAARDLDLVQGFIRDGVGKTIEAMGISEDAAKARWNDLLPVKGLAEQTALLKRLRAEASPA